MNEKFKIKIILGSTRENRQGIKVANWISSLTSERDSFDVELLDLRDWPLPFYDEPMTPSDTEVYKTDIANKWKSKIGEADGFIIATPEYNHSFPAVLKNALDFLNKEWNLKPVAFVSYSNGGISGVRAVEQLIPVITVLQMTFLKYQVNIPFVTKAFNEEGNLTDENFSTKAKSMLDSLEWWTDTLKTARDKK